MEINDSDAANLYKPKSTGCQSRKRSVETTENPENEPPSVSEDLSDNLLANVQIDDDAAIGSNKDTHNYESHIGSNTKSLAKESFEAEKPKSIFHLSDNMKKDLSMLAFPSKSHARKKAVVSSRITPNSRITIAEALEKAEDARKNISSLHKSSNNLDDIERNDSNLPGPCSSTNEVVSTGDKESRDVMSTVVHSDVPEQCKEQVKLDSAVTGKRVADGSPPSDAAEEAAACSEGKTVSVGGKGKSPGTSRIQMTRRMWEVLKFTFVHEHFPSSVHMARLAKMMGLPWSQVRNWFTDRRVDNKKAGIYPRDKPLLHCLYCGVTLETEAEQKSHLFSTQHVRRILGPEYCGGGTPESIKWKKLPKTVNAVSKMSGARILAVGFSAEDSRKKSASEKLQEKKVEPVVEEVPHSKELKKLWTKAMLLPEEKEPPLIEWNAVRYDQENNSDNKCESFKQGGKDKTSVHLTTQEETGKDFRVRNLENFCEKKVVSTSKTGSISVNVGDMIPGSTNDNALATANSSIPIASDVVRSTNYSHPLRESVISEEVSRHQSTKKSQSCQGISVTSEVETSTKVTDFGEKIMGSAAKFSMESPRLSIVSTKTPQKALQVTYPNSMKPKSKHRNFSLSPNNISQEKLAKSSTFASQLMEDIEVKQEPESDELWNHINNITLYRADGSDVPEKCELAVVSAHQQPLATNQSSATYRPCSPRSFQLKQKSSSGMYQLQMKKSGIRPAVSKVSRSLDKRKFKLRTQPSMPASKGSKANISVYEGNAIVGYQCPKCSKVYQTEWLMMKHSVTHLKYHCDICYQVYPDENMMKIHLLDHLSGAYEDEKYYCKFSCKVCHSLKCGCFEPTYCKPKDLPRVFFRPQKAKRSKKGFISKLNSAPNDHLKISLANYRKLLVSGGGPSKEISGTAISTKHSHAEDMQKLTLSKGGHKSTTASDSWVSDFVLQGGKVSHALAKPQTANFTEKDLEILSAKLETSHANSPKEKGLDAPTPMQSEVKPSSKVIVGKEVAKEKQLNWNEVRTKFTFSPKSNVNSRSSGISNTAVTDGKGLKRTGSRRRTKFSKSITYEDTVFYYMCEICDASFSTKSELSEHTFLHRLKSRSRRGEKRNISSVTEDKEFPPRIKVHKQDDKSSAETATGLDTYTCELCHNTFPTATDYRAHKILAHKEPQNDSVSRSIEVYRCNYCDKIYRRRRELKRHLKRDCTCAPPSLKGMLSGLSYSGNVIEDTHYTTLKIEFDDRSDTLSKSSGKCVKGPIVCKYCLAVTKREAEMKRHIWKFCLKVPAEVVKKFMDGASLEELGFKYIKDDKVSVENSDKDVSVNTNSEIPGALNFSDGMPTTFQSDPRKRSSLKKTSPAHIFNESNRSVQSLADKIETSSVQPESSENNIISMIQFDESKKTFAQPETTAKQSPIKHLSEETKVESSGGETGQSSTSASPLASPVMQFPIVLPVMTASAKSKRPLVCGYCGIWYFREMAILKHMKERCIKIPGLERELLKNNPVLCNVPQKAGSGNSSDNGAVYKMVKVPEHLQNTPVPMPKDVSNEDIKELNANINAFSDDTPTEAIVLKEHGTSVVKEQDVPSSSLKIIKRQDSLSLSATVVKKQDSLSSSSTVAKEQESPASSIPVKPAKKDSLSTSPAVVKEQDSVSSPSAVKEQDSLSSSSSVVREQGSLSTSSTVVIEQDSLNSLSTAIREQDDHSSSTAIFKEQNCLSSSSVSPPIKLNQSTTNKRGSKCRRCHEFFNSVEALLAHSSVHHGPKKGFYKCKLCHARLGKYKQLREHVWEHTEENPYKCHLCEVKYRSSDALVEHLHTQHQYTSINEKNLYKWLPGRHGRYRDIKVKNSSCEEKLDDVDTNLESLAEVMVITDKDICSKTVTHSKSKAIKCFEMNKELVDSENMQEKNKPLSMDSRCNSDKSLEKSTGQETKMPYSSDVVISTSSSVCSNKVGEAVNVEKVDALPMKDQNTLEKSLENIACVQEVEVMKENDDKRTPQTDRVNSKTVRLISEPDKETNTIHKVPENPPSGLDDDITGEGLLPLVDNLDSVVETVHLTDIHLS